jgi:hypothetical protein
MNQNDLELETWIIDAGHDVIVKESGAGADALSDLDRLIKCLWAADYGMRNAGDLETANEVLDGFQEKGCRLAGKLDLKITRDAFALSRQDLQASYFERLPDIREELATARAALP